MANNHNNHHENENTGPGGNRHPAQNVALAPPAPALPGLAGPGSDPTQDAADAYQVWVNQNHLPYLQNRFAATGNTSRFGGTNYETWLNRSWAPQLEQRFNTQRQANPGVHFDDFITGQEAGGALGQQAQNAYANRSSLERGPNMFAPAGRYSWWD